MGIFFIAALILGLCLSIMGLGIFISMKIFNIPDITTDGSYTFGAVITAILLTQNVSIFYIIPASIIGGAFAGMLTGIVFTKLKIDALLAGILIMTAFYSINLGILGRSNIPLLETKNIFKLNIIKFQNISLTETVNPLIICSFIVVVIISFLAYFLKTDYGLTMRATGNNENMVKALGINPNTIKIAGLAIANSCTAFAGFLVVQYQNFVDINMGIGIVITGLGSVLIADALIKWFSITSILIQLIFVVVGSIIFQFILAITLSLGIDATYLKLVTALFVLLIVAITKFKKTVKA